MKEPTPLSRRTLARMLACDVLYMMDLTGDGAERSVAEIERMLRVGMGDERSPRRDTPDLPLEHVRRLLGSGTRIEELVSTAAQNPEYPDALPDFSRELLDLYLERREEIDGLVAAYADRWSLERMPVIDRNLLRLGFSELLYRADIPANVTINEYLELAKAFSTEDSGKFINGVLGRLAKERGISSPPGGGKRE